MNEEIIKPEIIRKKKRNNMDSWFVKIIVILAVFMIGGATMYVVLQYVPMTTVINKSEKEVTVTDTGLADAVDKIYDSVVIVKTYVNGKLSATGTGFVFKNDNGTYYIMTNHHVVSDGTEIKVVFTDKAEEKVTVVGSDAYSDIAVLSLKTDKDLTIAEIGSSSDARVGDTVFAVGAPLDSSTYSWTVTRGILSGKNREVSVSTTNSSVSDYMMTVLQTDAAINSGNSGGPLCNSNGQVIGITNMKLVSSGVEGMGFAIPIEDALNYANKLLNGEDTSHPYLGVSMIDVANAAYYGIKVDSSITTGVVVVSVVDNSPAASAGLKAGDVITKLNDTTITSVAQLKYELYKHSVGDKISLTYNRSTKEKSTEVTLSSNTTES